MRLALPEHCGPSVLGVRYASVQTKNVGATDDGDRVEDRT